MHIKWCSYICYEYNKIVLKGLQLFIPVSYDTRYHATLSLIFYAGKIELQNNRKSYLSFQHKILCKMLIGVSILGPES